MSTGVSVVLVMESYSSNIMLCASYLTKQKGKIDQYLLVVKHCILSQKVHLILLTSFVLSSCVYFNLSLHISKRSCFKDRLDYLADQDWARDTGPFY